MRLSRKSIAAPGRTGERFRWVDSPAPDVAVEIAAGRVAAACRDRKTNAIVQSVVRPLPAGAVVPSATEPNIVDAGAVSPAVRSALDSVGGSGGPVILLVPDLTARVSILDFEQLPGKYDEVAALVRFRLRKTLPFDADTAALSVQALPSAATGHKVLVTVADRARIDEYENCIEAAGAHASIVMPSGLALLPGISDFDSGVLVLRADSSSVTSAFGWKGALAFYRVTASESDALAFDELYPSVAFYRDFLEANDPSVVPERGGRILVAGIPDGISRQLAAECPWANVVEAASPESVSGSGKDLLPVRGALVNAA